MDDNCSLSARPVVEGRQGGSFCFSCHTWTDTEILHANQLKYCTPAKSLSPPFLANVFFYLTGPRGCSGITRGY